jgi:hypothetical protein
MKPRNVLLLLAAMAVPLAGCCKIPNLETCPAIVTFETVEMSAEASVKTAFVAILPRLPADQQGSAQAKFNEAIKVVDDAMASFKQILQDLDKGQPGDYSAAMQAVVDAVTAVVTIADDLSVKQTVSPTATLRARSLVAADVQTSLARAHKDLDQLKSIRESKPAG